MKPDGNDSAAGTSWETALRTPVAGIEKIKEGSRNHELVLATGVYTLADALGFYGGEGNYRAIIRGATFGSSGTTSSTVTRSTVPSGIIA